MVELSFRERTVMNHLLDLADAQEPNYLKAVRDWAKPTGRDTVRWCLFNCGLANDDRMQDADIYALFLSACSKLAVEPNDIGAAVERVRNLAVDLRGPTDPPSPMEQARRIYSGV